MMLLHSRVALLCAALLAPATAAGAEPAKYSHAQHLEQGATCGDCHAIGEGAARPAFVADACEGCHDDGRKPPAAPSRPRRLDATFPHKIHLEKVGACEKCHAATAADAQPSGAVLMEPDACQTCHAGRDGPRAQCATCHRVDRRRVAPASHGPAWRSLHGGATMGASVAPHGGDCALCHRPDECRTCHLQTQPANHSALWRERTHGFAAEMERESCKQCHETGTCAACHRQARPRNHAGAWRMTHGLAADSKSDPRCATCHQPAWCANCHRGGAR